MDNSTKKSGGIEIPKRNRSLDLKSLYKSRVPEVGESKKKVSQENDQGNVKKKRRRSIKAVSLSCSESDAKKSRKEDVDGVKSEQGFGQKPSGGSKGLHGISFSLGEGGSAFNFPKRPRGSIGRKNLVTDQVSKPLGLANSVNRAGTFNDKVIKSAEKAGSSNQLGKLVTFSASNDGGLDSKPAGKVGVSNKKVKEKADPKSKGGSYSKLMQKVELKSTNGSDQISDSVGLPKSVDHVRAFNGEVIKLKGKACTSDQLLKSVTVSAGNDDASNPKSAGKVGASNSKVKQKAQPKSTDGSDQISKLLKHPKSVDRAGALNGGVIKHNDKDSTRDQLVKLVAASGGNDGASKSNSSKSKVKQEADPKPKGIPNAKVNQKADPKPKGVSNAITKQKLEPKSIGGSDQVLEPLGLPKSVDRVGAFNGEFIKPKDKAGTSDQLVKLVTPSAGNNGSSNSKSAGKVGGSMPKVKEKADPNSKSGLNSKTKQKADSKSTSGSNQVSEPLGLPKSVDHGGPFDGDVIKHKGKAGTSDQLVKLVTPSAGNNGSLNSKFAGKVGGSMPKVKEKADPKSKSGLNSKTKQKADLKSTSGYNLVSEPLGLPKSVDHAGAFDGDVIKHKGKAGTSDQLVKSVTLSMGNDGAPKSVSAGKVSGSNSKVKQKTDPKSTGGSKSKIEQKADPKCAVGSNLKLKQEADPKSTSKCDSTNAKLKRKAGGDELKENRDGRLCSIQRSENEDSEAVNNGQTSSKKRRINSRKKKGLVIGGDGGKASKKKLEPSVGTSVSDSIFVDFDEDDDDDDEEKLEQNAARMLSSRFDPSCTGFSSKRKSSVPQTVNGFSFPVSSSRYSFSQQANSCGGVDSASADDRNRELRPRKEDKGKGTPRKRRHFYENLPRDLDPHWFLNRRIKVFWPLDENWYHGLVNDYHPEFKLHHIKYDDRDEEWIDLQEEKFKLLLFPSEVPGKVKSKMVTATDKGVHKGETVPPEDDASCKRDYLDSEPIASWLPRSSQYGKSLPKSLKTQRASHTELPVVSASPSEKIDDLNSNLDDPKRTKNNAHCESTSADNLVLHAVVGKYLMGGMYGNPVVYARKKNHKKGEGSGSVPRIIKTHGSASGTVALAPVAVSKPTKKDSKFCGFLDYDKQLWSIDHGGHLRLNVMLVESKEFRFHISLPVLRYSGFSLGTLDFWLFRNMLMPQHGVMSTTSPTVNLEMLFVDNYLGLRYLLYEGCMKQALAFIFFILTMFSQPDESVNGDMQSPVTSVRLRLSSVHDLRKHHVVELHSFARLQSSKWVCLDFELLQHCVLIKQLQVSECTYDNIKELECGSLKQCKPHADLELPYMAFNKKFVPRILPMGASEEALNTRISQSASFAAKPGKVPQFALSFSAAPTFLLTRHLQLLMKNSSDMRNLNHPDALSSPENAENGSQPNPECTQSEPTLVSVQDIVGEHEIGTLETEAPAFMGLASSNQDSLADVPLISNVVEKVDSSENVTGSRCSWQGGRSSSVSSPHGDLSPTSPDGSHSGFSNGPKRPRTQVQYTLPGAGYDFSAKQEMQNQSALPCKRIRRASFKRTSDGPRSKPKNFELVACGANVLITHEDKGWRECGAVIVLEVADHNEWRLAIKLSGVTKYSYKVKHMLQPGSTNRYSHAMLWKGGKDWVLEFAERGQWNLFKEMHEECYNRNSRAASVKNIPIPGVRLIEESDDYATEVPFVQHPIMYYRQVQTDIEMAMDPSHILYDIESDDERWLMENKKFTGKNKRGEISEEFFEKTMDMFEKVSYVQQRDKLTDAEVQELVIGMGSAEAAKVIYEHWREKRGRKGMPLIRHIQPPLWELYQKQLKEWEHTVSTQERVPTPEKPPMFAFCQKPRGLDVPNKAPKQRSHRKFTVSGNFHGASRDRNSLIGYGRRSNGHTFGDEKVLYTSSVRGSSDVSPSIQASMRVVVSPRDAYFSSSTDFSKSNRNSKAYRNKSMRLGSYPSSRTKRNRDEVQPLNMGLPDLPCQGPRYFGGPHRSGVGRLDGSDLREFWVQDATAAADHATKRAKLKREAAQKLLSRADSVMHKAVEALIVAEAMRTAAN